MRKAGRPIPKNLKTSSPVNRKRRSMTAIHAAKNRARKPWTRFSSSEVNDTKSGRFPNGFTTANKAAPKFNINVTSIAASLAA
jgi:hypothetical protein